ncbi:hypothetical protein QUF72_12675 [Desulfobacterales bacterium HSG2]|nr:hypothetical protein [Desulfobacterales bacterium HSG2]
MFPAPLRLRAFARGQKCKLLLGFCEGCHGNCFKISLYFIDDMKGKKLYPGRNFSCADFFPKTEHFEESLKKLERNFEALPETMKAPGKALPEAQ